MIYTGNFTHCQHSRGTRSGTDVHLLLGGREPTKMNCLNSRIYSIRNRGGGFVLGGKAGACEVFYYSIAMCRWTHSSGAVHHRYCSVCRIKHARALPAQINTEMRARQMSRVTQRANVFSHFLHHQYRTCSRALHNPPSASRSNSDCIRMLAHARSRMLSRWYPFEYVVVARQQRVVRAVAVVGARRRWGWCNCTNCCSFQPRAAGVIGADGVYAWQSISPQHERTQRVYTLPVLSAYCTCARVRHLATAAGGSLEHAWNPRVSRIAANKKKAVNRNQYAICRGVGIQMSGETSHWHSHPARGEKSQWNRHGNLLLTGEMKVESNPMNGR